jgi:hypothetical protein
VVTPRNPSLHTLPQVAFEVAAVAACEPALAIVAVTVREPPWLALFFLR